MTGIPDGMASKAGLTYDLKSGDTPIMRPGEKKQLGRPPLERTGIERHLRKLIVTGKYQPGSRVPSVAELAQIHRASSKTVHEALVNLARDGFLVAQSTRGTFVTEHPPHLWQYAIANPFRAVDGAGGGSLMYTAQEEAVQAIATADPRRRMLLYHGIGTGYEREDDYYRLLDDVKAERVAGVIFLSPPFTLCRAELFHLNTVPYVTLGATLEDSADSYFNGCIIRFDANMWFTRAAERLASLGCKRVALLGNVHQGDVLRAACQRVGMQSPAYCNQPVHYRNPDSSRRAVELLFCDEMKRRPDALLIADDHFIPPVVEGLRLSKMRVPKDLQVVSMFNYPHLVHVDLPFIWLGYDARQSVRYGIDAIDAMRAGRKPVTGIAQPKFLEEIDPKAGR